MSKTKIDFALSVGGGCQTAYHLLSNGLEKNTYPLDWMMLYNLETVNDLFERGFQSFFKDWEENVELGDESNRYIIDKRTGMVAMHHFRKDDTVEAQYQYFLNKAIFRYKLVDQHLKWSRVVMFVSRRDEQLGEFEIFLKKMQKLYKCKMLLLNIKNDNEEKFTEYLINPKLKIMEYSFRDIDPDGNFWGNIQKWSEVLSKFELSKRFWINKFFISKIIRPLINIKYKCE